MREDYIIMKRTINKLENARMEIILYFEAPEWQAATKKALTKLAKDVEIPGFRKGHAPENFAKEKIGQAKIMNEAIDLLLPEAYDLAIKEEKIAPFARPKVDITKISDSEMEAVIKIITKPEVELGKYMGHAIGKSEAKVSKKDIDAEIENLQKQNAELIVKEEAAALGDTTIIDFEGFVDGQLFEGGKAENYSLELGSGSFIPGFEEQVVGLKAGDKKDIKVTFPKNYVANLADKEALFKITVHEVKSKRIPDLTEDFVAELNYDGVKTVVELKDKIEKDLLKKKESEGKKEYFESLLKEIVADSKVVVAEEIVEDEVEAMLKNFHDSIAQQGLTDEQYYQMSGQTPDDVKKKMQEDATQNIKSFLVLDAIAQKEEIIISQEIIDFEMAKIAAQYNMEVEKVKEVLAKNIDRFIADLRSQHIADFLISKNN